jgi:hypothetical protein
MNTRTPILIILVIALYSVVLFCTQPVEVAGGGSGTEISGCTITGSVRDTSQLLVSGGTVRLRPFDYLVSEPVEDTGRKQDGSIGSNGSFSFENVPAGHYIIECVHRDSFGVALDYEIDTSDTFSILPDAVVQHMAVISGSNMLSSPDNHLPPVQVRGLERSIPIDESGNFNVLVPAGWNRLHVPNSDYPDVPIDTLIYCNGGEEKKFDGPPHQPPRCDGVECDLAIVQEVLDSNMITTVPPESLVVITNNSVTELHLRGLGISVLPMSIGKLYNLKALDIGENELEALPPSIEHLHNLTFLRADQNKLWSIPAAIGTLDSLEFIDFAFNKLQSLPEPITYLNPKKVILAFNMLCNIGERTKEWLYKVKADLTHQECH